MGAKPDLAHGCGDVTNSRGTRRGHVAGSPISSVPRAEGPATPPWVGVWSEACPEPTCPSGTRLPPGAAPGRRDALHARGGDDEVRGEAEHEPREDEPRDERRVAVAAVHGVQLLHHVEDRAAGDREEGDGQRLAR